MDLLSLDPVGVILGASFAAGFAYGWISDDDDDDDDDEGGTPLLAFVPTP